MKEEYKKELINCGVNYDNAMGRLMDSEDIFETLVTMFLEDTSYNDFVEAVKTANVEECFKAGHTLKGVAANLSLDSINQIVNPLVEDLRAGKMTIKDSDMEELKNRYNRIIDVIKKYS